MAIETEESIYNDTTAFREPGCIEAPAGFTPLPPANVEQSIATCFQQAARRHADRIAVRYGKQAVTYRELDIRSNRLARTLLARYGPEAEPVALLPRQRHQVLHGLPAAGAGRRQ